MHEVCSCNKVRAVWRKGADHLAVRNGQLLHQVHDLHSVGLPGGQAGACLKFVEQQVHLIAIEVLCEIAQHGIHIILHSFKRIHMQFVTNASITAPQTAVEWPIHVCLPALSSRRLTVHAQRAEQCSNAHQQSMSQPL